MKTHAYLRALWGALVLMLLFVTAACDKEKDDEETPAGTSGAIVVTIDGLSFVDTLIQTDLTDDINYMPANIRKIIDIDEDNVRPFIWDGDAEKTEELVTDEQSELRVFLREAYEGAVEGDRPFVVIGHSWGSVLAYLALAEDQDIECDVLITLSSPLGTESGVSADETKVREFTDKKLDDAGLDIATGDFPRAKSFLNIYCNGDLISGPLVGKVPPAAAVSDYKGDDGLASKRELAGLFLWHRYTTLGDEVVNTEDPLYAAYAAYIALLGEDDISSQRERMIEEVVSRIEDAQ